MPRTSRARPDPLDQDTLAFILGALPSPRARLLEVGAGDGRLARSLTESGLRVSAIDSSSRAIRKARRAGRAVLHVALEAFEAQPFDALLFCRSLHHLGDLQRAIQDVRRLLKPGGWLLVDDFALERCDEATAAWRYAVLDQLVREGRAQREPGESARGAPLARWQRDHSHAPPLHRGDAMLRGLRRAFEVRRFERVPYLYRSLAGRLRPGRGRDLTARALLGAEQALIAEGEIQAVGWRLAAQSKQPHCPGSLGLRSLPRPAGP